ncbi:hypothetical protein [Stenomitos frigidus]|uniref:Uncharacterized protein n=1 Tax=Stenomitos frigidus ULC18 TaxID=2107698 RepID=A0A2T1E0G4_9CYAN|nr:hypothetical protein [Stenomitos frigidus]PSB26222.1 hypothetical protein C7B82_20605 [Stenomitos frigidus ULC18]
METQLDSFPVAQLTDRYNVARSNIYNRLQGLSIQPEKQGSKSVINADTLPLWMPWISILKLAVRSQTLLRRRRVRPTVNRTTGQ